MGRSHYWTLRLSRLIRDNSLSIVLFTLFVISFAIESYVGW
jgi:hypothetical protein